MQMNFTGKLLNPDIGRMKCDILHILCMDVLLKKFMLIGLFLQGDQPSKRGGSCEKIQNKTKVAVAIDFLKCI